MLYQGQPAGKSLSGGQRKLNCLVLSPNFERRHAHCIDKIYNEAGNIIYANDNFDTLYQDVCWESRKLLGITKPTLETGVVGLKSLIGRPVVVNGERVNLIAVGNDDSGSGSAVVCIGDGEKEEVLVCRMENIERDNLALQTIETMDERFKQEKTSTAVGSSC